MGDSQSRKARGNLGPRDGILHQTVSRLPVANHIFLGSWMVDICQEGQSQRSAPQRRHTAHLRWRSRGAWKLRAWERGGDSDAQVALVFLTDQNLGTGVDEKKAKKRRTWGTQVSSGARVLYSWQRVLI